MTTGEQSSSGPYRILRPLFVGFFKFWNRLRVKGSENIPAEGGFVLAPGGHRSIIDTPVLAGISPRMLRYMGAESYFKTPVLGTFLKSVGGFPVERDATDREALRLAEAILADGEPLVIFPESTRFSGPEVQPLKEGAAFLACRAQVPIIPVGIGGGEKAWPKGQKWIRPSPITLVVGEPIYPPVRAEGQRVKRSQIRKMNEDLRTEIQRLFDHAQTLV